MGRARISTLAIVTSAALALVGIVTTGSAGALVDTTTPQLTLNRLIRTSPFTGSSTSVRDNEGSAYVASDDALWMADDNGDAIYEVDRTTGALRRKISQTTFVNAQRLGVGGSAGSSRTEDLEALAYDANADVLYAFSGSTSAVPTVFRLTRDANQRLQVESWQPLPSEWTGAGWRPADGLLYLANSSTFRTLDYPTLTFGPTFSVSGLSKVMGIDFDETSGDMLAVNSSERLYRVGMSTRTIRTGWNGISLTGFGIADSRAVEVIGEQLFVTDGLDTRSSSDPMNHAVFVLDVRAPGGSAPTASFTASPTSGPVQLAVTFTDTSTGGPTSWSWTFGDGGTSTAQNPTHTYTATGTFTATLVATNGLGSTSASRTITVTNGPPPTQQVLPLDADSYFNTSSPTKNYGAYTVMKLHSPATAEYRPLVKFTVNGLSGAPQSVKLRLYVLDTSDRGGDWFHVSNSWTESTVTWNNAPQPSGAPTASFGNASLGTWIEIDLTSAVTGNGTYSFLATSPSSNTAEFSSREGTNPPQVVVVP